MKYEKVKSSKGRTSFVLSNHTGRIAVVNDVKHARMFASAPELLRCAEEALSYVNLFGQLSVGAGTALTVAKNLEEAILNAKGEEERY